MGSALPSGALIILPDDYVIGSSRIVIEKITGRKFDLGNPSAVI